MLSQCYITGIRATAISAHSCDKAHSCRRPLGVARPRRRDARRRAPRRPGAAGLPVSGVDPRRFLGVVVDEVDFPIVVPAVIPTFGQGYLTIPFSGHYSQQNPSKSTATGTHTTSYSAMLNTTLSWAVVPWRHAAAANGTRPLSTKECGALALVNGRTGDGARRRGRRDTGAGSTAARRARDALPPTPPSGDDKVVAQRAKECDWNASGSVPQATFHKV